MNNYNFDKISWIFLSEGNGRGSKLLQSYLDGSKNLLMIPGYVSSYFFPFIDKYIKFSNEEICEKFFYYFKSIFDSRKNPGSETLNSLGKNKKSYIKINRIIFKKKFLLYLKNKKKNKKNLFKAIHFAYFFKNEETFKNKIILSHVHVFKYFDKYIYKYFPNSKIITLTSNPSINYLRREKNSILRPNYEKFFYTDFIKSTIFSFYQTCEFMLLGHQNLKLFKKVILIKFEDLKTKPNIVVRSVINFLNLKYSKINKKMTFNKLQWNYDYYDALLKSKKIKRFDNIINHNLKFSKQEQEIIDLLFLNFSKKYKYKVINNNFLKKLLIYLKILLPLKIEIIHFLRFYKFKYIKKYFAESIYETININKVLNKYYGSNLFYTEKWSSIDIGFKKRYLFIFYLKIKKNNLFKNFLYKIIQIYYFISKIIFLLLSPLIFIKFYVKRIFLFYKFIIKDKFNLNHYPILITKK
jgi:hypothetical protein